MSLHRPYCAGGGDDDHCDGNCRPSTDNALRLLDAIEFVGNPLTDQPVPAWAFDCDCPRDPYHRWNCQLSPIWAQTMRDLDTNPWTVLEAS